MTDPITRITDIDPAPGQDYTVIRIVFPAGTPESKVNETLTQLSLIYPGVPVEAYVPSDRDEQREPPITTCQDCGKHGTDARWRNCPYAEEIYGKEERVFICSDCAHERAMDV